jgi:cobalamin biosynthesis Mg chelatase CobN
MNDWYDGHIDKTYKPDCYKQAIKNLTPELKIYSSARDDIEAAEQAAAQGKTAPPEKTPPPATTPTSTSTSTAALTTITTTTTTTGSNGAQTVKTTTTTTTPAAPKPKPSFASRLVPGSTDAFPLPLLILGALAILLVLAGAVGMLWQRSHPRQEPPATA